MSFLSREKSDGLKFVRKIAISFCTVGRTRLGFGTMGTQETIHFVRRSPILSWNVWMTFGFSRYAERLGRSPSLELCKAATRNPYIDVLLSILKERIEAIQPTLFLISIPFPGNLYSAFRSAG
jgi:hypothetical protein